MAYELGFSYHLYDVAVELFESMFLEALMTNMETWHDFGESWMSKFEKVEQKFFRGILKGHQRLQVSIIYRTWCNTFQIFFCM